MHQEWSSDELFSAWTLVDQDWPLVGNKAGATRLGFSVLLKFFEIEGRFPQHAGEVCQRSADPGSGALCVITLRCVTPPERDRVSMITSM